MTTKKAAPEAADEVQAAIAALERHGITVNLRPPGVTEADDVVAWLRAHGFAREAEAVARSVA